MKYRQLDSRTVYRGFFRLDVHTIEHERFDGGMLAIERENLERGDAVAVLLHDPGKDQVLLIEQFRIGPMVRGEYPWLIEIVAGVVDEGEAIEACARRECIEEAGYEPKHLRRLGCFYPSPGGMSERIFLYLGDVDSCQPAGQGGGLDHEHEDIRVSWVKREEALAMVHDGRINSAAPMLALLLAFASPPTAI